MRSRAFWIVLALAAPAAAYLLPAPALLERASRKRDEAKAAALTVQGTIALFGATAEGAGVVEGLPSPATLRFTGPLSASLEIIAPQGQVLCQRQGTKVLDCGGRNLPAALVLIKDAVQLLAARRSSDSLSEYVSSRGVDLSVVSLARKNGRVAYTIGAGPHDKEPRPQLWLDKDGFQPLRFAALDTDGQWLEITFAVYGKPPLFEQWPRTIEVRRAGVLEARFTGESIEVPAAREAAGPGDGGR